MQCPICSASTIAFFTKRDDISFFECNECESLFAEPEFLEKIETGTVENYENTYWQAEISAARNRSFGPSLQRVAETFLYCRIPINNFIDIGSGPGFLLDALSVVLPTSRQVFHGVELFPPEQHTSHPNYHIGAIGDLPLIFDTGCCIEVIEHLTPNMLDNLAQQLATRSRNGSTYYFGSGQPAYVKSEDPNYLDPYRRGHIAAYSTRGITKIFQKYGFNIIPLPGRTWAFLAEFRSVNKSSADEILSRIWTPVSENAQRLKDPEFGPLMYSIGIESARCYLEHAICNERTLWAQNLNKELANRTQPT